MKIKRIAFFVMFAFLMANNIMAQGTIQLTTAKSVGDEFVMTLHSTSSNDPITVDWGDGTKTTHNISPNDIPYFKRVGSVLRGQTITITGNIVSLNVSEQRLTKVDVADQKHLKELCLPINEISQVSFTGDVAPLEVLELNNNILANSTENNPTLGFEIFGETLSTLNLSDNNLICLNIETLTALKELYIKNNPSFTSIFIAMPEDSRDIEKIDLSNGDLSHFYPISMPHLTSLHLSNNTLMEDFVIDDYYPELKYLSINGNYIPEINVANCAKLEQFDCSANLLTKIDVSQNMQLTNFNCSSNQLTNINIANNMYLATLSCADNKLTKIDITQNTMLQNLNVSGNPITNIDLSEAFNLRRFEAANTLCDYFYFNYVNPGGRFEFIDVRNNPNLTAASLNCMYKTLPTHYGLSYGATLLIEGSNGETSDTSYPNSSDMGWKTDIEGDGTATNHPVAVTIDAQATGNSIKINGEFGGILSEQSYTWAEYSTDGGTFAVAQWDAPYYQRFKEVTEEANVGVPIVIFAYPKVGHKFHGIEVNGKMVENNSCVINEPSTIKVIFKAEENSISFTTQQGIPLSFRLGGPNETNTIEIDWGNNSRQEYQIPQYSDFSIAGGRIEGTSVGTTVTIYGNVTYANFESEPYFAGWDNQISSIDLSQNPYLQYLDLYWNPITSIDLTGLSQLQVLGVSYTALKELNLNGAPNLLQLECYSDGYGWEEDGIAMLSKLDISKTPKLIYLDAKNNQLESINFEFNSDLSYVNISNNKISSVDITKLPKLWYFKAASNKLTEIDLTQNVQLLEVMLDDNDITNLNLTSNNSIQLLSLENNALSALNLKNLKNLIQLKIGGNGLTAAQLNDIYYSLNEYPELTEEEQGSIAGYPLNVGQSGEETPNDAYGADASIATSKGWSINIAGNGNGCETTYIDILDGENGSIRLFDINNNEIVSGTTTLRNSKITVVATPNEGYSYKSVVLNGNEEIIGDTLMIGAYCKVQPVFIYGASVNNFGQDITKVYAGRGAINIVAGQQLKAEIYTLDGRLIYKANVADHQAVAVPLGMYIVKVTENNQITTHTVAVQ